jgi:hypothetical protein
MQAQHGCRSAVARAGTHDMQFQSLNGLEASVERRPVGFMQGWHQVF